MSKLRVVNLLDDFELGGVTRGLAVFDAAPVRAVADAAVQAVAHDAVLAPRLAADIAVIHFPPNWRRLLFMALLRLRNPRTRIVLVEHSYTGAWEALKVRHRGRFRAMLRLAAPLVDRIVCVSAGQARWLSEEVGVAAARIGVIHPWSATSGLDAVAAPDPTGRLRIGTYGRFCEQKGFDALIVAFRDGKFPGCELIVGGFGPDEAQLQALAGGAGNVRFAGKVTDIPGFLGGCDVVALPSRWEAYGQVANEAREAGRPILVSAVDGLPEQVGEAGLVVDFTDRAAIARALAQLTPVAIAAMSAAGRAATAGCGEVRARQWADLLTGLRSAAA